MGTSDAPPRPAGWVELVRELVLEARGYVRDLGGMARLELKLGARSLGTMVAMVAAGVLVLLFSFLFLSLALVGGIAYLLESWRWALLVVGVGYALIGAGMLGAVARRMRRGLLRFEHTRRRLREDAQYLKSKLAA
ncbi:MAG TPA: phage holin family protein [Terriglobales bacterium]|nr:phage holin family protein [Terriglobales bacterium]